MERGFEALSLDGDEKEIVQVQKGSDPVLEEEEFCLVGCFLTASVIHILVMRSTMANLWHPGSKFWIWGKKGFYSDFFTSEMWRES